MQSIQMVRLHVYVYIYRTLPIHNALHASDAAECRWMKVMSSDGLVGLRLCACVSSPLEAFFYCGFLCIACCLLLTIMKLLVLMTFQHRLGQFSLSVALLNFQLHLLY